MRLVLFGDVVLGVLLEVALLAGDLDPRRHLQPRRPFQLGQFRFQLFDAGLRDRLAGPLLRAHAEERARNQSPAVVSPATKAEAKEWTFAPSASPSGLRPKS